MNKKMKVSSKITNQKKMMSATAMLLISALMLGISTYAWFTMSKELEVNGIQMTATAPENVQISLGALSNGDLSKSTGLISTGTATNPGTDVDSTDWSNSADISAYYTFGKLFPASSTNGVSVFYTKDASGIGRTLKNDAAFTRADDQDGFNATLHAWANATEKTNKSWAGKVGFESYDVTNDDGYYVDIPVWFRTNAEEGTKLTVVGYVTHSDDTNSNDDIYEATRVAILNADKTVDGGLVNLQKATSFSNNVANSIIDSLNYDNRTGDTGPKAVSATTPAWSATTIVNPVGATPTTVVDLTGDGYKGQGNGAYGTAMKKIIRVWIEGEDNECYNANAGQTFKIALKFK